MPRAALLLPLLAATGAPALALRPLPAAAPRAAAAGRARAGAAAMTGGPVEEDVFSQISGCVRALC